MDCLLRSCPYKERDSTLLKQIKMETICGTAFGFGACHFVCRQAVAAVVPIDPPRCSSARPSTSRTLVPLLEATLDSTLARPRQRARAKQIVVAIRWRESTQHNSNLRAHWPGGALPLSSKICLYLVPYNYTWLQKAHV